jgi:hypothetical protein
MWFFFGFITLGVFCVSSLLWRRQVSWSGKLLQAGQDAYELKLSVLKGKVRAAKLAVDGGDDFSFTLTPEDGLDRLSKAIGLTRECQTGDAAFDDALYICSDDAALHRMLQTDRALRDDILRLVIDCPAMFGTLRSIEVHRGRVWIVATPLKTDRDEAEEASRRIVPLLKNLAARLSRPQAETPESRDPFPLRAACILAISTGLIINGGFETFRMAGSFPFMLDPNAPVAWALSAGLGIVALLVVAALAWLGRSARTHLVLIELVLIGLIGATLTAYAEIHDFNIDLDRAAPTVIPASVGRLYLTYTTHKNTTTTHCQLELIGWPTPAAVATREISCDFYAQLRVGQSVAVEQHPGALGWPWVSAFLPR